MRSDLLGAWSPILRLTPAVRSTTVVEAARAAARTRYTYLSAQYHRIAARRGSKSAAVAVAHTILVIPTQEAA